MLLAQTSSAAPGGTSTVIVGLVGAAIFGVPAFSAFVTARRAKDLAPGDRWSHLALAVFGGAFALVSLGITVAGITGSPLSDTFILATAFVITFVGAPLMALAALQRAWSTRQQKQAARTMGHPVRKWRTPTAVVGFAWVVLGMPVSVTIVGLPIILLAFAWQVPATDAQQAAYQHTMNVAALVAMGLWVLIGVLLVWRQQRRHINADREYATALLAAGLPAEDPSTIMGPLEIKIASARIWARKTTASVLRRRPATS